MPDHTERTGTRPGMPFQREVLIEEPDGLRAIERIADLMRTARSAPRQYTARTAGSMTVRETLDHGRTR